MFFGSENAMAVIPYDLRGGHEDVDVSTLYIALIMNPSFTPLNVNFMLIYLLYLSLVFFRGNSNTG